jgi:hemoglobin
MRARLAASLVLALAAFAKTEPALAQDDPSAPYTVSDANAGATPITDPKVFRAFHGREGVERIVSSLIVSYHTDRRLIDIFHAADFDRLHRLLVEQICYILGGPCHYTGQAMRPAHADMGIQTRDFDALVEDLQAAMRKEQVPFWAQNRLLAKLAPMKRLIVTR